MREGRNEVNGLSYEYTKITPGAGSLQIGFQTCDGNFRTIEVLPERIKIFID